jgi:hypothetical protein
MRTKIEFLPLFFLITIELSMKSILDMVIIQDIPTESLHQFKTRCDFFEENHVDLFFLKQYCYC